jgi:hypothetical protein
MTVCKVYCIKLMVNALQSNKYAYFSVTSFLAIFFLLIVLEFFVLLKSSAIMMTAVTIIAAKSGSRLLLILAVGATVARSDVGVAPLLVAALRTAGVESVTAGLVLEVSAVVFVEFVAVLVVDPVVEGVEVVEVVVVVVVPLPPVGCVGVVGVVGVVAGALNTTLVEVAAPLHILVLLVLETIFDPLAILIDAVPELAKVLKVAVAASTLPLTLVPPEVKQVTPFVSLTLLENDALHDALTNCICDALKVSFAVTALTLSPFS